MDINVFLEKLSKGDKNLEKELIEEYDKTKKLNTYYLLGVFYSEKYSKPNREKATIIFKELLNKGFKKNYIYSFLATQTMNKEESEKYIREGIKQYPDNQNLKNILIYYIEDNKKEEYFNKNLTIFKNNFYTVIEMISYYYDKKDYKKAFGLFDYLNTTKNDYKREIDFLKIAISYLANEYINKETNNSFIVTDNNSLLGLLVRLIDIDYEKNSKKGELLIMNIDYLPIFEYEDYIEIIDINNNKGIYFMLNTLFYTILDKLANKYENENIKNKIKLIKGMYELNNEEEKYITEAKLRDVQKMIEIELVNNNHKKLYEELIFINFELGDNKKSFLTYIKAIENSHFIDYFDFSKFNIKELEYALNYLIDNIKIDINNSDRYQYIFEKIVKKLHILDEHKKIVKIFKVFDYTKFDYLKFGFELAFAFNKEKNTMDAKKIYEDLIANEIDVAFALNNLGAIYENEGNIEKAFELYTKAEPLFENGGEICINNIERCKNYLEKQQEEDEFDKKSLVFLQNENIWIIQMLSRFYDESNEFGHIICSYNKLPTILKCNNKKAQEALNYFLEKGYVSKLKEHNYDTLTNVYKKNFHVEKRILENIENYKIVSTFTEKFDNFTFDKFSEIKYSEILIKLNNIKNENIRAIFIRDYNELVFNYLANQKKSTVLMSGTIIELLLIFILNRHNIMEYKINSGRNKKINEMNMTEMLEVCNSEKLLHNTPSNFIDGMRQFRNFIHPGKELREEILKINNTTLELLFSMVNWLIFNIDFS